MFCIKKTLFYIYFRFVFVLFEFKCKWLYELINPIHCLLQHHRLLPFWLWRDDLGLKCPNKHNKKNYVREMIMKSEEKWKKKIETIIYSQKLTFSTSWSFWGCFIAFAWTSSTFFRCWAIFWFSAFLNFLWSGFFNFFFILLCCFGWRCFFNLCLLK